ncbi:MAG: PTS sugar transporter subunit IIA [Planctomycetota bacterium]|jgi:mannitol/fructose-specific phosphotransferase system IIA component (Ntr-type)
MKLSELLTRESVILPLAAADKWQAIRIMAESMVGMGALPGDQLAAVEAALVAREESMTTGMEDGIAIPHAAVDHVPEAVAVLGIAPEGVPFEALDGQPARILVCLVIPRAQKLQHIRTLAEIAKLLSRAPVRERLLSCDAPQQVLEAIAAEEG